MRFVFSFALFGVMTFQARAVAPPKAEHIALAGRTGIVVPPALHPEFERYEGGTPESEAHLVSELAGKFAQLQTNIGVASGGNLRGTHSNGVCLDGSLEIYGGGDDTQKGPFGKARTVDARIRFADAASSIQSNKVNDVRSVSFSFTVDGKRQDFSMNNAPNFTFGNITDFNNFMAYALMMGSVGKQAKLGLIPPTEIAKIQKAFFEKNPDLARSVMKTQPLADLQRNKDVVSYHTENYGSGTAFLFGDKQAAKFSLVRCGDKEPLREKLPSDAKDDVLVTRITDVVNNRPEEFCFELKADILDADKMRTPDGKKLEPWQWVEDSTLDWTKAGARSVPLAKLTAKKGTMKSPADCNAVTNGFDVSTHSFPEIRALGRINRARHNAEQQSQHLRARVAPATSEPVEGYSHTTVAEQGWDDKTRDTFWYTPQGSYIVPYNWFMALKDPKTGRPLHETLGDLGFLSTGKKSALNPDGLPIGVVKESEPTGNFPHLKGKGDWLGVTCAACHTGAVTVNGTRHIIDGAPAKADFEKFVLKIDEAIKPLLTDEKAFAQFKSDAAALGSDVSSRDLQDFAKRYAESTVRYMSHGKAPANSGPGRTDAFSVILNRVNGLMLGVDKNVSPPAAPVSFPQLWGAPYLRWIQYNGLTNSAPGRNIGEVLGVFGEVNLDKHSKDFLSTTARVDHLKTLEGHMRTLQAPKWEAIFGRFTADERERIARGAKVYGENCARCHTTQLVRELGKFQPVTLVPATEFGRDHGRNPTYAGTDPSYFAQLLFNWTQNDLGNFKGDSVVGALFKSNPGLLDKILVEGDKVVDGRVVRGAAGQAFLKKMEDAAKATFGEKDSGAKLLGQTTLALTLKYIADNGIVIGPNAKYLEFTGGAFPEPQTKIAFKARSLEGIWATAPYLHNGSVRTLAELLKPPHLRETDFYVGGTDYDTKNVGYKSQGSHLFRANTPGNLAIGHDFGTALDAAKKEDLLMYLKSL